MRPSRVTNPKMPPTLQWVTVPADTQPSQCSGKSRGGSCTATIYWVDGWNANSGKPTRTPVDCDVDGGSEPAETVAGAGINHYKTCPDANLFHRGKR